MQDFAFLFVFSWIIRSLYDICMYERDCDPVISGHGHFRSFSFFNNIRIWHIRKKNIFLHLIK